MFTNIQEIEPKEIMPGFHARFVHTENMTVSFWQIEKNSVLQVHAHPHEQVSQVLEGRFELTIAGETKVMEPGDIASIPSGATHSGRALTYCRIMDIFSPAREDYKNR